MNNAFVTKGREREREKKKGASKQKQAGGAFDRFPSKRRAGDYSNSDEGRGLLKHRFNALVGQCGMADGGACSSDPFRLPGAAEELTYPFGNGLVVRYGLTSSLVSSTAAVAASAAELPPSIEVPAQAAADSRVVRGSDGSSRMAFAAITRRVLHF